MRLFFFFLVFFFFFTSIIRGHRLDRFWEWNFWNTDLHCLIIFVWVEALQPSQQFSTHVRNFFLGWTRTRQWTCDEDKMLCLRTQPRAPGEIRTPNHAIESLHYANWAKDTPCTVWRSVCIFGKISLLQCHLFFEILVQK